MVSGFRHLDRSCQTLKLFEVGSSQKTFACWILCRLVCNILLISASKTQRTRTLTWIWTKTQTSNCSWRHGERLRTSSPRARAASLTGVSELAGPSIFTLTFAYFVTPGHRIWEAGAPFMVAALILAAAAAWAYRATSGEDDRPAPPPA